MTTDAAIASLAEQVRQLTSTVKALEARIPAPLATPAEAARHLGVSIPTIRRWVKAERIAYVRRGRSIRIDLSRVRALDADEIRAMRSAT